MTEYDFLSGELGRLFQIEKHPMPQAFQDLISEAWGKMNTTEKNAFAARLRTKRDPDERMLLAVSICAKIILHNPQKENTVF